MAWSIWGCGLWFFNFTFVYRPLHKFWAEPQNVISLSGAAHGLNNKYLAVYTYKPSLKFIFSLSFVWLIALHCKLILKPKFFTWEQIGGNYLVFNLIFNILIKIKHYFCSIMKLTTQQIEKIKTGLLKAIKEKQAFVKHFANGGKVEDFKSQENRNVVRPI